VKGLEEAASTIAKCLNYVGGAGEMEGYQNSRCRSKAIECLYGPAVNWKIKWVHSSRNYI